MIINTEESSVEVIGDIEEFKTSIDPKNLEFITTLLSSNLYSAPEQSFIREIVSNAWDSHVEADNTDTPVIIKFDSTNHSITIRDFGIGLSPERFKDIYCNIGSSTKRDSNDFIGGFGLGRFSSLACSNTTFINSYYNGTAYNYIMTKSGNVITYNKVAELPTKEKNGVEVTIKNIYQFDKFQKALEYLVFFPNIYIDGLSNKINDTKIKRYKNFASASISMDHKLLLGNVLYPCDNVKLSADARFFLSKISRTGIVVRFNVGELNITPNRESIIYTSESIAKIEQRLVEAKKEMDTILKSAYDKDYDDIVEYSDVCNSSLYYDFTQEKPAEYNYGQYQFSISDLEASKVTYKGKDILKSNKFIDVLLSLSLPQMKGFMYYDRLYSTKLPWDVRNLNHLRHDKIIVLENTDRLLASFKSYIRDNFNKYAIIKKISLDDFKIYVKDVNLGYNSITTEERDYAISEVYNNLLNKATFIDIATDSKFLKYKEDLKNNKVPVINVKNLILYVIPVSDSNSYYTGREKKTFKSYEAVIKYLKGLHAGIVIDNLHDGNYQLGQFCNKLGYYYITANKELVNILNENPLDCFTTINYIVAHNKKLSIINTINSHKSPLTSRVIKYLPEYIREELMALQRYYNANSNIKILDTKEVRVDPYTNYLLDTLEKYIVAYQELLTITNHNLDESNYDIVTALIVKLKLFRVDYKVYKQMKNNVILQMLCKR